MRQQKKQGCDDASNRESGSELRPAELGECTGSPADGGNDKGRPDQESPWKYPQDDARDHGSDYAAVQPFREAAAVASEIGSLNRDVGQGHEVTPHELLAILDSLLVAPAATADDALAFAATARSILPALAAQLPQSDEPDTGLAMQVVAVLVARAVDTLERITGTPASTFTGNASGIELKGQLP